MVRVLWAQFVCSQASECAPMCLFLCRLLLDQCSFCNHHVIITSLFLPTTCTLSDTSTPTLDYHIIPDSETAVLYLDDMRQLGYCQPTSTSQLPPMSIVDDLQVGCLSGSFFGMTQLTLFQSCAIILQRFIGDEPQYPVMCNNSDKMMGPTVSLLPW